MALVRFFKVPKNQKFDYKPRYWDPKKEALEERLGKYKEENKGDAEAVKRRLKKGFQGKKSIGFKESRAIRRKELRRSNRVLLLTIVVLVLLAYLLFEVYSTDIIKMLE